MFESGSGGGAGSVGVPATYEGLLASLDRLKLCYAKNDSVVCTSHPSGLGVGLTVGVGAFYSGVVGSSDSGGPAMPMGTEFTTPSRAVNCNSSSRGIACTDATTGSGFTIGDHYVIVRNAGSQRRYAR